ncbi:MAG: hypothetical protein NT096_11395 [Proteobacteria bacterium]|nr:hypothetical protein [Pseudomonadota bacterium]
MSSQNTEILNFVQDDTFSTAPLSLLNPDMSDRDSKSSALPGVDETLAIITGLPAQLPGDPRRQAVFSIHGDVYQAWWSIDAWLRLADADEVVYLEGAEDFDVVRTDAAITVQVKRNTGTISLGTAKAHVALENFWTLSCQDVHRQIDFHYLTTSSIAVEQDGNFGGAKGIEVWRAAQTNPDLAIEVARYLVTKLDASSPLRMFLSSATPQLVQKRLIQRFHWLTNQPDLDVVKRSVDDRITVLLNEKRRSLALIPSVRKYIESRFWEIVLEPSSARRCLTRGELLRQVEAAITTYLPVAVDQLPDLLGNARPGLGLLNLLLEKSPRPPEPLLRRPELTHRLEELVKHRKVVLLTGTVHKGKTTVAQLVSSTLCPTAWWVNLTGRQLDQVDNVLLAIAGRIERGDCPSLVVIDDLDISPAAHRVYRDSLALVLHRASTTGRGILLTARGGSSDLAVVQDFKNVELLDVPELSSVEIATLCIDHGCPHEIATSWGSLITAWTRGHPKLVQVRLAELAARDWPSPSLTDLTTQSSAVTSVRQMARQLLSDSAPGPIVEFVYLVSECLVPVHRSIAIRLAENLEGLTNGGDVLDKLTGKWLERLEGECFRTTALLNGVAADVWSPEKRKWAHIRLHDAILAKHTLDPSEAAALLFHAYIGGEPRRIGYTAIRLQQIDGEDAKREVERQLLWLPFVALETGQSITDDAMAGAILRGLQFRVASTLDSESLPQICARWAEDIERIPHSEARTANRAMMWLSTGFAESPKVPLKPRLGAIMGMPALPRETLNSHTDISKQFFEIVNAIDGLPKSGTTAQAVFLCATRCVRDLDNLGELLQWLDNVATEEIRQQFDAMLEWPLVQSLGAFVQGAFASIHEQTKDWEPWLVLLECVDEYAKRRGSPRFGREAAKARAIILTEYLSRSEDALRVLEQAEATFGPSSVLMEQRANVLFQKQDDESMLEIWSQLTSNPVSRTTLDPFAYRRAGMSAARLKQWEKAGQIFRDGADSIQPGSFELTKFGLSVDAALAISRGGDQAAAAKLLADAVLLLPAEAATEGNERWEAVQRVAVSVCTTIENTVWKPTEAEPQFECGYASSPGLKFSKAEPGQAARSEITRAQVLRLVSTLAKDPAGVAQALEVLAGSRYFYVRWMAIEARLALAYSTGAGAGFVEALLAFDRATAEVSANMQQGMSLLDPDDGPKSSLPVTPERWFGLLCAGVVCTGPDLLAHLKIWLDESTRLLGEKAVLTDQIRLLLKGASQPAELLQITINDAAFPIPVRYGAVAQLLRSGLPAGNTLKIQAILTSGLMRDEIFARQQLFNRHVARCFAEAWRTHAQSRFQFYSPSTSVPALLGALESVECGSGTLKSVLVAAANVLRQPLGSFMGRVL